MPRIMTFVLLALSLSVASSCVRAESPKEPASADAPKSQTTKAATPPTPRPEAAEAKPETVQIAQKTPTALVAESSPPTSEVAAAEAPTSQSQPAPSSSEAAAEEKLPTKQEILNSPQWRRAMFEFNEWLTAQPIYTPEQVKQIKDGFNHRVAAMDAKELVYMLADMEAKFQVMDTPQAKEARAWMAQYLSVMSDKKRAEVLKNVPNIATMTAAQLNAEIQKIIAKRQTMDSEQEAFQRGQAQQVANQLQTDRINQRNYVRDWNTGPVSYSPYRNGGSNVNQRLNNTPTGAGMGFYVGPLGGVGMTFAPSSW